MRKKRIKGRSGGPTLYHPERETENYSGILEPSVAQPPLPLQEFLPLQPLSLDLQPPLPLQEFWPLQACFSFTFESSFLSWALIEPFPFALERRFAAWTVPPVPANKPASAAPAINDFLDFVIFPHTSCGFGLQP